MGKNSQIHFYLETSLKEHLEKEAKENHLSFSEFCRKKLCEDFQFSEINNKLDQLIKKSEKLENKSDSCT